MKDAKTMKQMKPIRIVIMGGGGTGKSCITVNFVQNMFVEKYDPTIEDSYRKSVIIDNVIYPIEILDTAGTEEFTSMRDLYIKNADGIILVYSLTSAPSVHVLEEIHEKIQRVSSDIPIIIAANKCDMEKEIVITGQAYRAIQAKYNCQSIRTSAKTSEGVLEIFNMIISLAIENRQHAHDQAVADKPKSKRCIIM